MTAGAGMRRELILQPVRRLILLCVRWYCRYSLAYRDLEEMMRERGLSADHITVFRWVQRYAPEINKRMRPYLKMSGTSYRLDKTYVKIAPSGNTCTARSTLPAAQLSSCSARSVTFLRQNASLRS